jgi:hypothetical protein
VHGQGLNKFFTVVPSFVSTYENWHLGFGRPSPSTSTSPHVFASSTRSPHAEYADIQVEHEEKLLSKIVLVFVKFHKPEKDFGSNRLLFDELKEALLSQAFLDGFVDDRTSRHATVGEGSLPFTSTCGGGREAQEYCARPEDLYQSYPSKRAWANIAKVVVTLATSATSAARRKSRVGMQKVYGLTQVRSARQSPISASPSASLTMTASSTATTGVSEVLYYLPTPC